MAKTPTKKKIPMVKLIRCVRSPKTNAYTFKTCILPQDQVDNHIKKS